MVDSCPESPGLEEMNAVQIGYVHPSVKGKEDKHKYHNWTQMFRNTDV